MLLIYNLEICVSCVHCENPVSNFQEVSCLVFFLSSERWNPLKSIQQNEAMETWRWWFPLATLSVGSAQRHRSGRSEWLSSWTDHLWSSEKLGCGYQENVISSGEIFRCTMKECLVCTWGPFHEGPVHRGKCPSAGAAVEGKMEWFYHIESMLMSSSVPIQSPKSARLVGSFYNDEDESDLYNWPVRYHIKKKLDVFLRFAHQQPQTAKF